MTSAGIMASAVVAVGFKAALGNAAGTTGATTLVITTTAAIAIGDLVVVRVASDNLSATTPTVAATDSGGNTYTSRAFQGVNATAAAGVVGAILATKATAAVASGGTITLTFTPNTAAHKAAYAESFIGFDNTLRVAAATASGASTAATVTSGSATADDLVVGMVASEDRAVPSAYATDTTRGTWSTGVNKPSTTSGTATTAVEVNGQHKIVNATGTQVYANTVTNSDWAALVCVFQKAP